MWFSLEPVISTGIAGVRFDQGLVRLYDILDLMSSAKLTGIPVFNYINDCIHSYHTYSYKFSILRLLAFYCFFPPKVTQLIAVYAFWSQKWIHKCQQHEDHNWHVGGAKDWTCGFTIARQHSTVCIITFLLCICYLIWLSGTGEILQQGRHLPCTQPIRVQFLASPMVP